MTPKDKQLLLKDICARLSYGVNAQITAHNTDYMEDFGKTVVAKVCGLLISEDDEGNQYPCIITCYDKYKTQGNDIETIKPYLRPLSSMTEEEENEYRAINCYEGLFPRNEDALDYLLSHHFDYCGLIGKGLALEAPDEMYKIN